MARNVLFLLLLEVNTVAAGSASLPGELTAAHMSCCGARRLPSSKNPNTRILLLQTRLTSTWSPKPPSCADVNNHRHKTRGNACFPSEPRFDFALFPQGKNPFIQGQYLPSFYNSIFAEAPEVVLKFSNLSIMQVLFKTAHFRGIPHAMLLNEHKNHIASLKIWKLPKNIPNDNKDKKRISPIQSIFSREIQTRSTCSRRSSVDDVHYNDNNHTIMLLSLWI